MKRLPSLPTDVSDIGLPTSYIPCLGVELALNRRGLIALHLKAGLECDVHISLKRLPGISPEAFHTHCVELMYYVVRIT